MSELDTAGSTAPETSVAPETSAAPAAPETSGGEPSGDQNQAAAPAFTPNFKFKVLDKEHEIPEFLRGAMKDAATEKQLKELHEKAFGLDVVKPKYQETKRQLDEVRNQYTEQTNRVNKVLGYLQKNDFASFVKELNISEEQILRYALERVQYRELPLEQRMAIDAQAQERERLRALEAQTQTFEQKYYAEAIQNRALQLDYSLTKPEIKSMVEAFDAKVGRPGAFRAEVINRGQLAYHATGADISVEQAMNEVLALARGMGLSDGNPATPAQALTTAQGQPAPKPPIIPNVQGRGASPTKPVISSISQIRKRAAEL